MAEISKIKTIDGKSYDLKDTTARQNSVYFLKNVTGTAANGTTGKRYASKWNGTAGTVTSLSDGMVVIIRVPVAGNGTYGTVLNVNNLGEHPVVYNINSMISTRYGVNSSVVVTYNSTQTATAYINDVNTTITGVWQVCDYDSTNNYQLRRQNANYAAKANTYRYQILLQVDENTLVPVTSVDNSTATTKALTTESFNPFGNIYYYATTTTINAGSKYGVDSLYMHHGGIDLRIVFNTGTTLTAGKDVYIVCKPQGDGKVKLHTAPISQSLPTTDNGLVYIYLGQAYSTYQCTVNVMHPVYCYKDGILQFYTGNVPLSDDDIDDICT